MLFDSHCHLSAPELAADLWNVLDRARAAGVSSMLNIGDSVLTSATARDQAVAAQERGFQVWATAGVHPQHALDYSWRSERPTTQELRSLLGHPLVCAVGEIGLDFVYDETHPRHPGAPRTVQELVLREQLELACELGLPVVLHNRQADARLLAVVAEYRPRLPGGVFHCFGSAPSVAEQALELGFHLGFTGLVTFKHAGEVRQAARLCPRHRILIETDSPYLAPVPHRGKTNQPSYLPRVAETLALLYEIDVEELAGASTRNALELFSLPGTNSDQPNDKTS